MGFIAGLDAQIRKSGSLKLSAITAAADVFAWSLLLLGLWGDPPLLSGLGMLAVPILTLSVLLVALPLSIRDMQQSPTRGRGLISLGLSLFVLVWNIHSFATWDL